MFVILWIMWALLNSISSYNISYTEKSITTTDTEVKPYIWRMTWDKYGIKGIALYAVKYEKLLTNSRIYKLSKVIPFVLKCELIVNTQHISWLHPP